VATLFLHNQSFVRASDAREFLRTLPQYADEYWYWNIWRTRQRPFSELEEGALVGLVLS
jgi:hypothetical protein